MRKTIRKKRNGEVGITAFNGVALVATADDFYLIGDEDEVKRVEACLDRNSQRGNGKEE